MVVEQAPKLSIENRKKNLLDFVESRIKQDEHAQVFGDTLIYWQHAKSTVIELSSKTLKGKSWNRDNNFSEIVHFEVGETTWFKDSENQINLRDEEALEKINERIHEFVPLRIVAMP